MKVLKKISFLSSKNINLIILFILFSLCLVSFQLLPFDTRSQMLDTHFGFTKDEVILIVNSLGEEGRSAYVNSMFTNDFLFPITYTLLMLGLISKIGFKKDFFLYLPILACISDLLQNIQTATIMSSNSISEITNLQILLASCTNQIKWLLIIVIVLSIAFGSVKKLIHKIG